jgi:hypothetical protein
MDERLQERILAMDLGEGRSLRIRSSQGEEVEASVDVDGRNVGDLLVGDEKRDGGMRLVLCQLYLDESGTGIGARVLRELCQIMADEPGVVDVLVPCTEEGSFVWSHLGVPCTEIDSSFAAQVGENLDVAVYEGQLDEDAERELRARVADALTRADAPAALREVGAAHGGIGLALLEDAQWMGVIDHEALPGLLASLNERIARPRLSSLVDAPAPAAEVPAPGIAGHER